MACVFIPHVRRYYNDWLHRVRYTINPRTSVRPHAGTPVMNEIDELVLLAIAQLGDDAYGVTIRREIADRSGRKVSMAGVYVSLERLEDKGLVESSISAPLQERGGRARKMYDVTGAGAIALRERREMMERMWRGLETHPNLGSK